jgi:biopolymer transport protein ExbD
VKLPRAEIKKARIEIIPMIDAIFFPARLLHDDEPVYGSVELEEGGPAAQQLADYEAEGPKVVVSLTKDGELYVDQSKVAEAGLVSALAPSIQKNPEVTVILNVDRDQQMGRFSRVFDLVKQANPAKVMLAATPKDPGELPTDAAK